MSWQDVRGWYEEPDDHPEPPEVELVEATCFECGHLFASPAGDGERFCSLSCEDRWCRRAAAATGPTTDDEPGEIPF